MKHTRLISRFRILVSTALRKIVRAIISRIHRRDCLAFVRGHRRRRSRAGIICIFVAWGVWCRVVDIRETIIGSGAPFRSHDHPDIHLDMHLAHHTVAR